MEGDVDATAAVVFAAPSEFLRGRGDGEALAGVLDIAPAAPTSVSSRDDPVCRAARTALLVPFSFWTEEDELSPAGVCKLLLSRTALLPVEKEKTLDREPLWELTTLPEDVAEFSLPFRTLLGFDPTIGSSAVARLRVTDTARNGLFSRARLWADTKTGTLAGRQCEWRDVQLLVFPHGAVLSIKLDWMAVTDDVDFHLSELRTWLYVSKFRSVEVGVHMGWGFLQQPRLDDASLVSEMTESLGLKLFAALFGGSLVTLSVIANWLVKFPSEDATNIPRRVSRHDYCLHRTFAIVDRKPRQEKLDEFLYHIQRAHGIRNTNSVPTKSTVAGGLSDQVLRLYPHSVLGMAREGVFGLCWGEIEEHRTFQHQFHNALYVLSLHALSERITLERLSYLEALRSQSLPSQYVSPIALAAASVSPAVVLDQSYLNAKDKARNDIARLSNMLVRYRSCMASDDCGGRPEYNEYFVILRQLYSVPELKEEIGEELQDMLSVVHRDYIEEYQRAKSLQEEWEMKRDEIASNISKVRKSTKNLFDVSSNGLVSLFFPVMLGFNLMSMNLTSLPRGFPFYAVLIITVGISVILIAVSIIYTRYIRNAFAEIQAEKDALKQEMSESKDVMKSGAIQLGVVIDEVPVAYMDPAKRKVEQDKVRSFWQLATFRKKKTKSGLGVKRGRKSTDDSGTAAGAVAAGGGDGKGKQGADKDGGFNDDDNDDDVDVVGDNTPEKTPVVGPSFHGETDVPSPQAADQTYFDPVRSSFSIDLAAPTIVKSRGLDLRPLRTSLQKKKDSIAPKSSPPASPARDPPSSSPVVEDNDFVQYEINDDIFNNDAAAKVSDHEPASTSYMNIPRAGFSIDVTAPRIVKKESVDSGNNSNNTSGKRVLFRNAKK